MEPKHAQVHRTSGDAFHSPEGTGSASCCYSSYLKHSDSLVESISWKRENNLHFWKRKNGKPGELETGWYDSPLCLVRS